MVLASASVILTRLSRVTFHTAHKYLGLTKEVMRTEKAINESACFSLPAEFYEQGGMERLRQRFLPEPKAPRDESEDDYFRDYERSDRKQSENKVPPKTPGGPLHRPHTPWGHPDAPLRTPTARTAVGPGDLLSMTGTGDELRQSGSPVSATLATPRPSARSSRSDDQRQNGMNGQRAPVPPQSIVVDENATATSPTGPTKGEQPEVSEAEEPGWSSFGLAGFDLKDEVMRSIAKSIGLAQAPSSQPPSVQASPYLSAQDALLQRSVFNSAFSSLSMLEGMMGDDESSLTGTTSSIAGAHHAELENEVEIRFFPAGSMLVKAGESHAGLFYVIDGFLDVLVPPPENENDAVGDRSDIRPRNSESGDKPQTEEAKVKPSTGNNKSREDGGRPGPRPSSGHPDGGSTGSSRARPSALGPSSSTTRVSSVSKSRVGNALDGTLGDAPLFPRSKPNAVPPKPMPPPLPKLQRDANPAPKLHPKTGPRTGDGQQKAIFSIGRGGIAGYLSSLLGAASYVDVRAKTDTYVGFLPAHALERMMERKPIVLLTLCKRLLSLLSPLSEYSSCVRVESWRDLVVARSERALF